MKSLKYLIILIVAIHCQAIAKPADSSSGQGMMLMFSMDSNSFGSDEFFNGFGFGFALSKDISLRFNLGLGYDEELSPKPENAETDKLVSDFHVQLNPSIRFDIAGSGKLRIYAGPQFMIAYTDSSVSGNNFKTNEKFKRTWDYGFGAFIGAELRPIRNVGLALEFCPLLTFTQGKQFYKSGGFSQLDNLPAKTKFNMDASSIRLVFSFYF
jgi:opacity protein-like surface antigen